MISPRLNRWCDKMSTDSLAVEQGDKPLIISFVYITVKTVLNAKKKKTY